MVLNIDQVSYADQTVTNPWSTHLIVHTNNQNQPQLEEDFSITNFPVDQPPCNNACDNTTDQVLQPVINSDYTAVLNVDSQSVSIQVTSGDWVSLNEIDINFPASSGLNAIRLVPEIQRWDVPQVTYTLDVSGHAQLSSSPPAGYEQDFNPVGWLENWNAIRQSGFQVMLGEFGVYNQTPQDVTLAWFKDQLTVFQQDNFNGWATWDPFSEYGIFSVPRPGETPENYANLQLNRPMLDLLMQY